MKKGAGVVPRLFTFLHRAAGKPLNKLVSGFGIVGLHITDRYFDGNKQACRQTDRLSVTFLSHIQDNKSALVFSCVIYSRFLK